MNKKYLNIILLTLLIFIWGSVFYKHFGGKKAPIENIETFNGTINNLQNYVVTKDSFQLELADRDPFGITITKRKPLLVKTTQVKKQTKKPLLKKNITWPVISYHGFVKGESNNTRLILLKINNKLYRKREKEIVNNITLVKAYNDSLLVAYNNNHKIIKR